MERYITFDIPMGVYYDYDNDEEYVETKEYHYYYDDETWEKEIIELFSEDYKISKEIARKMIVDLDLWDTLEDYYCDDVYQNLKEKLYDKACEEYYDMIS